MSKPVRTWVSEQARRGPKVTDPFLQERIAELVVQGSQSLQYLPEEEDVLKDCEEGKARYFLYINGELGDNKLYQMLAEKAQHVHPFVFSKDTMRKESSAALKDIWQKVEADLKAISEKGFRDAKKTKKKNERNSQRKGWVAGPTWVLSRSPPGLLGAGRGP